MRDLAFGALVHADRQPRLRRDSRPVRAASATPSCGASTSTVGWAAASPPPIAAGAARGGGCGAQGRSALRPRTGFRRNPMTACCSASSGAGHVRFRGAEAPVRRTAAARTTASGGRDGRAAHQAYVAMAAPQAVLRAPRRSLGTQMLPYRSAKRLVDIDQGTANRWTRCCRNPARCAINRGEGLQRADRLHGNLALQLRQVEHGTVRSYRLFPLRRFALEVRISPRRPASSSICPPA